MTVPQAAIGSGSFFANYAMAAVAHLDTPSLSMDRAKVVAYRTIDDLIHFSAFGIGPPISMCAITASSSEMVSDPVGELSDAVDIWKTGEREALGRLGGAPGASDVDRPEDPGLCPYRSDAAQVARRGVSYAIRGSPTIGPMSHGASTMNIRAGSCPAVQPQVRIGPLQRPLLERRHSLVELAADPRDGALDSESTPNCSTRRSTLRVDTPFTYASATTLSNACSDRFRGSRKLGK